MKTIRFILLLCIAFISVALNAQTQRELEQLMRDRGEYYFLLSVADRSEVQTINSLCSVDGFDGNNVVCYTNQQQYDKLLQAGYEPNLQMPPSLREEARMWDGSDRATYEWDSYPTYSAYQSMMQGFPATAVSGRTCTYMELGTLSSGRKIMGVRINNGSPDGKPKFMYSSTIHGDETTGWIMLLRLIDELCTSTDSRIVNLVNNLDIFIFPNTNPDGTYYGGNNTVNNARRQNANSVDMNRNYPDPHGSAHPDGNAYQTETQWFMTLAETYPFVMAANYHGGAEVVNYPWDNTSTRHADDAWWQYVSQEYANLCHAVSSSYLTTCTNSGDTPSGITNGADWYTIGGGRQDYMNGYRQCREVTVECSNTKKPSGSSLPSFWNYNHNAMLAYMEQCLKGVHGFVYDVTTYAPLDGVTVTVQNHDDQYSTISSHEVGDFHRPIKGGNYTFVFSKTGYESKSIEVSIADDQRVDLQVYLVPNGAGTIGEQAVSLKEGWNWWSTNLNTTAAYLQSMLGSNVTIVSQDGTQPQNIAPNTMYMVHVDANASANIVGIMAESVGTVTLVPGVNWIGYPLDENLPIATALANLTPTENDIIKTYDGEVATYSGGAWHGTLTTLKPGKGYIYQSNADVNKTFVFPTSK